MARTVIGLKRAVQEIALTEDEDSPVFRLDLGDKAIMEKSRQLYDAYLLNKAAIDKVGEGDAAEADEHTVAVFYQDVIESMLGKAAFAEIVAYVRGSASPESTADGIVLCLTPLVLYLIEQIADVVLAVRQKSYEKYLGGADRVTDVI